MLIPKDTHSAPTFENQLWHARKLLAREHEMTLTYLGEEQARQTLAELTALLAPQIPFFKGYVSTLGGDKHATVMFSVSFDPREQWSNGIYENSRYARFNLNPDGTFEKFSGHGTAKLRKSKAKNVADVAAKVLSCGQ